MWCPNQECPDAIENDTPGEFAEGILACPFCGTELVPSMPAWAVPSEADIEWVPCLTVGDISLLPQMRALLDAAGVQYFVKGEGVQNLIGWGTAALGFNPATGPPVLMVEAGDVERANEALGEFKQAIQRELGAEDKRADEAAPDAGDEPHRPTPQPASTCAHCGKTLEASEDDEPLTACYHCGWPLESA